MGSDWRGIIRVINWDIGMTRLEKYLIEKLGANNPWVTKIIEVMEDYEGWSEKEHDGAVIYNIKQYIHENLLDTKSRTREFAYPRFYLFAYLRKKYPRMAYEEIGRLLGGRDHGTVMHGIRNHDDWEEAKDAMYKSKTRDVRRRFPM